MENFEIFDTPKEIYIKTECDYEGLRKVTMFELNGNATTNNSLLIKSSDCNVELYSDDLINSELIFSVSSPNIKRSDLSFKWKNFDTLTIIYKKDLRILKQEFESKTVNPKIIFEYTVVRLKSKIVKFSLVRSIKWLFFNNFQIVSPSISS
jgi:hypothetical protein